MTLYNLCNHQEILIASGLLVNAMTDDPVSLFIAALKRRLSVVTDEELANILGVGKSTIASWRRRQIIPRKWQLDIQLEHGVSFHRFQVNPEHDRRLSETAIQAAVYLAVMRLGREVAVANQNLYAAWLAENDHRLRALIFEGMSADEIIQNNPERFVARLLEIASGNRATPAEIIDLFESERAPAEFGEKYLT